MKIEISVLWSRCPCNGWIEVLNGTLSNGSFVEGQGSFDSTKFYCSEQTQCRLDLEIDANNVSHGADPTIVSVCSDRNPFSFFLRDVKAEFPIFIPDYNVIVTASDDRRDFNEIEQSIKDKKLLSNYQRIDIESEESCEKAAENTRRLQSPIWMGVSRDVRIFELGQREPKCYADWIQPRWQGHGHFWSEPEYTSGRYGFVAGRGWGCTEKICRYLDDGVLPIFHADRVDDDIRYEQVSFVTLEKTPLMAQNIRGTHPLVADGLSVMHAFDDKQEKMFQKLRDSELNQPEETVLCYQAKAVNTVAVPRYAFFKSIYPLKDTGHPSPQDFDMTEGFGKLPGSELVFGISRLDGKAMTQEEIAVLLEPGESVAFEFFFPHSPIPQARARELAKRDFQDCLNQCRNFWNEKLQAAGKFILPEKRIDEMTRAGLLHLDMVTYGLEPAGALNVSNGVYSALGSETTRNIQFFDSMGLHNQADRCLEYFLDKQCENGLLQNFEGYMLETGAILWCMGEHYRYDPNEKWVEKIKPKVVKACDFILAWREKNKRPELKGLGYGLLDGKVADPEDPERTFMLNGYAYLGLIRAAEMLSKNDPAYSGHLLQNAEDLKADIHTVFFNSLANGPVVPLADGSWCPTVAPWAGQQRGPLCLFADRTNCWTHGSMAAKDDIIGPMHLVFQEVLDIDALATTFMLNYHSELFYSRNVSFSQPYYSIHPIIHLKRGETKRFLKSYYNTFAALADRETYSFWEHFYHESPHKTAEEAQFLMQTRFMLYMEDGKTLKLLHGIPRKWLEDGGGVELKNVASYFGHFSMSVTSDLKQSLIEAEISCDPDRKPESVSLRLPHPQSKIAKSADGGCYNPKNETIVIDDFQGQTKVKLFFD